MTETPQKKEDTLEARVNSLEKALVELADVYDELRDDMDDMEVIICKLSQRIYYRDDEEVSSSSMANIIKNLLPGSNPSPKPKPIISTKLKRKKTEKSDDTTVKKPRSKK